MGRWHRFLRLSQSERWLLFQAFLLVPLTSLALRLLGFKRLHAALAHLTPMDETFVTSEPDALAKARAITRIVQAAAWHGLFHANCLQRSLALWWLLRRQGIEANLQFGVRKLARKFEAHAWVEHEGVVLNDSGDVGERFVAFAGAVDSSLAGGSQ